MPSTLSVSLAGVPFQDAAPAPAQAAQVGCRASLEVPPRAEGGQPGGPRAELRREACCFAGQNPCFLSHLVAKIHYSITGTEASTDGHTRLRLRMFPEHC